jgi:hypothetical protein
MDKKTIHYLIFGGVIYILGYKLYKFYKKPTSVLVSGSSANAPKDVVYSTAKESMLSANGSLDSLIYIKKPIFIKPTNSIPNVYDRGVGQEINFDGLSKDTTPTNIQSACRSSMNRRKAMTPNQSALPILPYN